MNDCDRTNWYSWTIYEHPRDYPNHYVVRKFVMNGSGSSPTSDFSLHNTLEDARTVLPPGLYNFGRYPEDEPHIVETWF